MICHTTYYFIRIYILFVSVPFPSVYIQFLPLRLFLFAVHHTIPCHIIFPSLSLYLYLFFILQLLRSLTILFPISQGESPLAFVSTM